MTLATVGKTAVALLVFSTLMVVGCARKLAASIPQAKFVLLTDGHNDWANQPAITIRNP